MANTIGIKQRLARRAVESLMEKRGLHAAAPGGSQTFQHTDATGFTLTIAARGDVFEVFHGREVITGVSIDARVVLRLGWWIVWHWWVRGMWCGLKARLWRAALQRV